MKWPYLSHNFNVSKADSAFMIEFSPDAPGLDHFVILLAFQEIPTYNKYELGMMVEDLFWNSQEGQQKYITSFRTSKSLIL